MPDTIQTPSGPLDNHLLALKEVLMKDELRSEVCSCITDSLDQHTVNIIYNLLDIRKQQTDSVKQIDALLRSCAHQLIEHNVDKLLGLTPSTPTASSTPPRIQKNPDPSTLPSSIPPRKIKPAQTGVLFGYNHICPGDIPRDMADDGHFDYFHHDPAIEDWRNNVDDDADYDGYLEEEAEDKLDT